MEELIKTKLYEVLTQSCLESEKVLTWRGKIYSGDTFEWKITSECVKEDEEFLIRIKKR